MSDRSGSTTLDPAPLTEWEIADWLLDRVGYYLDRPAAELSPVVPLSRYGLESVYAFALCAEIESVLGPRVHPAMVWNTGTADAIAAHLAALPGRRR